MKEYDVIVIGGGSGGLTVASGAASLGAKTALIEKSGKLGGDCLHYGCIPSKALIAAANEVYQVRQADKWGLSSSGEVDLSKVMDRVKMAIDHIQEHDSTDRFEGLGVDVYMGKARFEDQHTLSIAGKEKIKGKRVIISTGSRPFIPEIEGMEAGDYETNETIFNLQKLPKTMVIIGGGSIGLEIAQAFSRLGTKVTVLERSTTLLAKEDKEIREIAQAFLEKEIHFIFHSSVEKVEKEGSRKKIHYRVGNEVQVMEAECLFVATGRVANTDGLGLENVGLKLNENGSIPVENTLHTSVKHIYAIGDVNGQYQFTHAAGMEGKLVIQNAVFGLKRSVSYENFPWTTYTTPEIFHCGLTEEEAREKEKDVKTYYAHLDKVDRFIADDRMTGFVKIVTDQKGKMIGAHAIGHGAGDWMQTVIYAMEKGEKISALSNMTYPYPNHTAAIQQTADLYWREKLFDGIVPKLTKRYLKVFR